MASRNARRPASTTTEIFKEFVFESAHRLPNVAADHKCARIHGHSFRAEVHVTGRIGDDTGWVMDYGDLRAACDPVRDALEAISRARLVMPRVDDCIAIFLGSRGEYEAQILRIELTVFSDNARAISLYRKFGFVVEGTLVGYAYRNGRYVDAYTMARLRPDADLLFGKPPKMHRSAETKYFTKTVFDSSEIDINDAARRILSLPSVASKSFLITIGDRSVGGMTLAMLIGNSNQISLSLFANGSASVL